MNLRQDIVDAIVAKLSGITTVGGYSSNCGSMVKSWYPLTMAFEGDLVNVKDISDVSGDQGLNGVSNVRVHQLTIEIDVIVSGAHSPKSEYVRQCLSDILAMIGTDETFGVSGVIQSIPVSDQFMVKQDELQIAGARLTIEVDYQTSMWGN